MSKYFNFGSGYINNQYTNRICKNICYVFYKEKKRSVLKPILRRKNISCPDNMT